MWDLQSNQARAIAKHAAPIRHMQFLPQLSLLVTGSWDRTVAYWDARTAEPALRVQLPERVYAMHSASSTLVVGTAARHVQVASAALCERPSCGSLRSQEDRFLSLLPASTMGRFMLYSCGCIRCPGMPFVIEYTTRQLPLAPGGLALTSCTATDQPA